MATILSAKPACLTSQCNPLTFQTMCILFKPLCSFHILYFITLKNSLATKKSRFSIIYHNIQQKRLSKRKPSNFYLPTFSSFESGKFSLCSSSGCLALSSSFITLFFLLFFLSNFLAILNINASI